MKKLLALLLALVMVFALAACGGGGNDAPAEPEAPAAAEPDAAAPEAPAEPEAPAGDDFAEYKVYFGEYAAAGAPNDEERANMENLIAGCEAFEDIEALQQSTVLFDTVGVLRFDEWLAAGKPAADTSNMGSPDVSGEPSGEPSDEPVGAEFTPIDVDPLDISFSTNFNETETGGEIIHKWIDLLAEYSNGNITVTPYWGGTLFGDADILDALESGAINMTTFGHMPHIGTLNYLGFPTFAPGGTKGALDFFEEICFNNPETSALVQGELAEHNVIFLNVLPGGANAFCTKYEFTDLASMVSGSKSFGNMDAAIFEELGFQVTATAPWDCYDALQRGLIDATQMGFAPMVSMQWYDVAPYWALDGTYGAGNFMSANLDWWNGLTADQQAVIQAAADAVADWSMGKYDAAIDADVAAVEAATGNKFVQFSQEDIDAIWAANFEAKAAAAMDIATANGKAEGMTTILELAAELTDYNWVH